MEVNEPIIITKHKIEKYKGIELIKDFSGEYDLIINLLSWHKLNKYNLLDNFLNYKGLIYNLPYYDEKNLIALLEEIKLEGKREKIGICGWNNKGLIVIAGYQLIVEELNFHKIINIPMEEKLYIEKILQYIIN